jgi:hypothetical protein
MASFLQEAIVDAITLLENDAVFITCLRLVAAKGRAKVSALSAAKFVLVLAAGRAGFVPCLIRGKISVASAGRAKDLPCYFRKLAPNRVRMNSRIAKCGLDSWG